MTLNSRKALEQSLVEIGLRVRVWRARIDQLSNDEGLSRTLDLGTQPGKRRLKLRLGDHIKLSPLSQQKLAPAEELKMPGQAARGAPDTLGDGPNFAALARVQHKDSVCFGEIEAAKHYAIHTLEASPRHPLQRFQTWQKMDGDAFSREIDLLDHFRNVR